VILSKVSILRALLGVAFVLAAWQPIGGAVESWTLINQNSAIDKEAKLLAWPELPENGFIVGRTANRKAVQDGNAVFVLEQDGVPASRPINMVVPQYAYHVDRATGKGTPCIVLQAEEFRGVQMIGSRDFVNDREFVDVAANFMFLGVKPKSPPVMNLLFKQR
jgi:hypothetical protein